MSQVLRLRVTGLSWRLLDDAIIVLDLDRSRYLSVRGAGVALWPLLERGSSLDELVGVVVERFEIDQDTAAADVGVFIEDLRQRGLLAESPVKGGAP